MRRGGLTEEIISDAARHEQLCKVRYRATAMILLESCVTPGSLVVLKVNLKLTGNYSVVSRTHCNCSTYNEYT